MSYNFNNVEDLKAFIADLLDGYVPTQLDIFDNYTIESAIRSLKENGIELTGNNLFSECVNILNYDISQDIISEINNSDAWEVSSDEIKIIKNFDLNDFERSNIFDYYANGTLDSHIYMSDDFGYNQLCVLKIIDEHSDVFDMYRNEYDIDIDFSDVAISKYNSINNDKEDIEY